MKTIKVDLSKAKEKDLFVEINGNFELNYTIFYRSGINTFLVQRNSQGIFFLNNEVQLRNEIDRCSVHVSGDLDDEIIATINWYYIDNNGQKKYLRRKYAIKKASSEKVSDGYRFDLRIKYFNQ